MQSRYPNRSALDVEPPVISGRGARQGWGRALLAIAAVGALFAMATSIGEVLAAGPDTLMLRVWQSAGFAVFAGLFGLLAYRPLSYAGIWELVILNKMALTVVALTYASGAEGASKVATVDGALTAMLLAGYVLCMGWRAWSGPALGRPPLVLAARR